MMKAAFFEGPRHIVVRTVPDPVCPPGGLLTRVEASAICGSDLRKFEHGSKQAGEILGHETVATVIEVGEGVSGFEVGQRVTDCPATCGVCRYCLMGSPNLCHQRGRIGGLRQGGFAELRPIGKETLDGGFVIRVPDGISSVHATLVEPLACVLNGHEKLDVGLGSRVAIIGAGPIGCMHLTISRMRGAGQTIIVDVLDRRLDMARQFGADHYVNGARVDPVRAVMEITGGQGADVVIVACVSSQAQVQALEMASRAGQVLFFAGLPENSPTATLDTNLIHYHELRVVGARSSVKRQWDLALELLSAGKVNAPSLITHTVSLDDIQAGFEMVKAGKAMKVAAVP